MDMTTTDTKVNFKPIVGIDHPVVAVRSMVEARRTFQRLGFIVPPRGAHLEWGTGNWCVMMPHDYLELRGIVDEARYLHGLDAVLNRSGEGLMGCAFATDDGSSARAELVRRGLNVQEPRELTRRFELPDGPVPVRFRLFFFDEDEIPGLMSSLICEHLTPTVLRRPEWMTHPNGALAIQSVSAIVEDLDRVHAQCSLLFGESSVSTRNGGRVVVADVGRGARYYAIHPTEAMRLDLMDHKGDAFEGMIGTAVRVASDDAVRSVLEENGVPHITTKDNVVVPAQYACGMSLTFTPSEPY